MSLAAVLTGRAVETETGCWEWTGFTNYDGYGRIGVQGKYPPAHRYVYEQLVGPVPDELVMDHLCRNPACVRPDHLEPVTQRENILRGEGVAAKKAQQTHCIHGHEFTPENTWIEHCRKGGIHRRCKTCMRIRIRDRKRRQRAAAKAAQQIAADHDVLSQGGVPAYPVGRGAP